MSSSVSFLAVVHCLRTLSLVAVDLIRLVALAARPRAALVAENLFLRKQLARFQERKVRPRRADASTRWMLAALSQWFAWRDALVNVQADTLLRWHRQGFRLFWRLEVEDDRRPERYLHHFVRDPAKEEGIGLVEVRGRVTMQVFVRDHCTMIAAPVWSKNWICLNLHGLPS